MVLYNVTVAVDKQVEEEWKQWMQEVHIPEVMDTGKFTDYKFFRVLTNPQEESVSFSIQYFAESMKELQLYMAIDAPELQKAALARFPDKTAAFRSVLQTVD